MTIDFHAHVLPGMDHGCRDLNTAVRQLERAKRAGVDVVVAAPHFYPHMETAEAFLRRRREAWEKLEGILSPALPMVLPAAEILVCRGMENMKDLTRLAVGDGGTLLLELPGGALSPGLAHTLAAVAGQVRGRAVLAHVDRYDENSVEALFSQGLYGQVNIDGLCAVHHRGRLLRWVREGRVAALGTDIHGVSGVYRKLDRVKSILGVNFREIMRVSEGLLFDPDTAVTADMM